MDFNLKNITNFESSIYRLCENILNIIRLKDDRKTVRPYIKWQRNFHKTHSTVKSK